MSVSKDLLLRVLNMLQLIPREPRRISTSTLHAKMLEDGFDVDMRTIQRDLNVLYLPLGINRFKEEKPYRWSFMKNATYGLVAMESSDALALYMAEGHLRSVLPKTVMDGLQRMFDQARNTLASHSCNGLAHWSRTVRTVPNGKALLPAPIAPTVWEHVSNALTQQKVLRVQYLGRGKTTPKTLCLHPAGLVSRHSISYVIASVEGYDDVRQFALHRIQQAECLEGQAARAHEGFDIDAYIAQELNAIAPIQQVELVADVAPSIAWLLGETPLSHQQTLTPLPDSDWLRLRAQVADDQETQWWVFSLGENIRVHAPVHWVPQLKQRAEKLMALYATE